MFRAQSFLPMKSVRTDNGPEIRFIHTALTIQNPNNRKPIFQSSDRIDLYCCRYLGIRHNRGKKKGVGMTTDRTTHSCYSKNNDFILELNLAFIRTIKNERARESTSAGNLVQINRMNRIIIKILRNIVVVFCFNCYHSKCHNDSGAMVMVCGRSRSQTLVGEISAFLFNSYNQT